MREDLKNMNSKFIQEMRSEGKQVKVNESHDASLNSHRRGRAEVKPQMQRGNSPRRTDMRDKQGNSSRLNQQQQPPQPPQQPLHNLNTSYQSALNSSIGAAPFNNSMLYNSQIYHQEKSAFDVSLAQMRDEMHKQQQMMLNELSNLRQQANIVHNERNSAH